MTYAIHTNALRQKEKKKDVQEIHRVSFSVISAVSRKCRLLWANNDCCRWGIYGKNLCLVILTEFPGRQLWHNELLIKENLDCDAKMLKKKNKT